MCAVFFILQFGAHSKRTVRKWILFSKFKEIFTSWLQIHGRTMNSITFTKKRRRWDDFFLARVCKTHCLGDYFLNPYDF